VWKYPEGPIKKLFKSAISIGNIFDLQWNEITPAIVQQTNQRDDIEGGVIAKNINLYLAGLLVTGLTPQPSYEDYFMQDESGILGSIWMQKHFSRASWFEYHSGIHIEPNRLIQLLNSNIKSCWDLHQHVVIDEMIVPFDGRWKYKQYVKNKPHNTGLKIYCLADSSYYLWDFWLYQGEESLRKHRPKEIVDEFSDIVLQYFPQRPFIFTMDSYYGGIDAAYSLHYKNLGVMMSCKANMPSRLFSQHLHTGIEKGEWRETHNKEFSALTYYDKAKINLLTNLMLAGKSIHSPTTNKVLPVALYYYRQWLGSVDHHDRQLHLYWPLHRNLKWHSALLQALLKIAVNNTWVMYNELNPNDKYMGLKEVTKAIIHHLTKDTTLRRDTQRPLTLTRLDNKDHWPEKVKQGRCVQCQKVSKDSNTSYGCTKCKVHLHVECFMKYHLQ
jgi:hypothetical protein